MSLNREYSSLLMVPVRAIALDTNGEGNHQVEEVGFLTYAHRRLS